MRRQTGSREGGYCSRDSRGKGYSGGYCSRGGNADLYVGVAKLLNGIFLGISDATILKRGEN